MKTKAEKAAYNKAYRAAHKAEKAAYRKEWRKDKRLGQVWMAIAAIRQEVANKQKRKITSEVETV